MTVTDSVKARAHRLLITRFGLERTEREGYAYFEALGVPHSAITTTVWTNEVPEKVLNWLTLGYDLDQIKVMAEARGDLHIYDALEGDLSEWNVRVELTIDFDGTPVEFLLYKGDSPASLEGTPAPVTPQGLLDWAAEERHLIDEELAALETAPETLAEN